MEQEQKAQNTLEEYASYDEEEILASLDMMDFPSDDGPHPDIPQAQLLRQRAEELLDNYCFTNREAKALTLLLGLRGERRRPLEEVSQECRLTSSHIHRISSRLMHELHIHPRHGLHIKDLESTDPPAGE
ncbi:MAG: hypothetical protein IJ083_06815 [Clostridia bacterium]|nr:hypothetical protein [Clostridia bacterium]